MLDLKIFIIAIEIKKNIKENITKQNAILLHLFVTLSQVEQKL